VDRTDVTLQAVIRALTDVVAPAVDPEDALAREQLRLSIDHLRFLALRVDRLYERAVFELRHHLHLAEAVTAALRGQPDRTKLLDGEIADATGVLASAGAAPATLRAASAAVAAAISAVVRELDDAAPEDASAAAARPAVVRAVVAGSAERVAFERSWYAPLGIDPDHDELPALDQLLRVTADPVS
jgi:hypothetical protein